MLMFTRKGMEISNTYDKDKPIYEQIESDESLCISNWEEESTIELDYPGENWEEELDVDKEEVKELTRYLDLSVEVGRPNDSVSREIYISKMLSIIEDKGFTI